jgi:signal transduction histidine kinase
MQRLTIARSLRLALVGLTLALAVLAALGLSSPYSGRQRALLLVAVGCMLSLAGALALISSLVRGIEDERRRLAITIDSLGDGLIVTEPGTTTIAAVNRRASEFVPELAIGGSVEGAASPFPPTDAALAGQTTVEHRGRTLEITAARLGDEADGVVWTLRDATERARLERAKSEFVATASHELRSPLTSIKGFIELLYRSSESMSKRQREFVEIILNSTERLNEMVADLLDVARIEADRVEIAQRPIDVGEAVHEVVQLMGPRIAAKHQRLSVQVAPTLPLALADPARLRQIVANLLTNAHLYTGEGGSIELAAERDGASVQISVRDSGVGMTPEQTARVFDRFYRADDGPRLAPGTGLGLSIVKSLVELHGGRIEVDSEPDRGSIFRVRLPAALPGLDLRSPLGPIRARVLEIEDQLEVAAVRAG